MKSPKKIPYGIPNYESIRTEKEMEYNSDFSNLSILYNSISRIFEQKNMLDSALFYAQKHIELSRRLHSNTIAIETHQKYITTLLETKDKELTIAEQKNELRNRLIIIILILLLSAILLVLLFYQQKRHKTIENKALFASIKYKEEVQKIEKEKHDEILEAKIREITSYSLLVSAKNHILGQVKGLNSQTINSNENAVKTAIEIDKIINENLNTDQEWDNFKMHFDKVHPNFFEKLKQSCNHLTEENMKLCAYFKIGLSNKQIAQMLHVLPRTIIYNRSMLKKKFELPEEQSLSDFIDKL